MGRGLDHTLYMDTVLPHASVVSFFSFFNLNTGVKSWNNTCTYNTVLLYIYKPKPKVHQI